MKTDVVETQTCNAVVSVKKGSTVNYRTSPSINASQVFGMPRIKNGERVYVKTTDGKWAAVEYKTYRGYVMMEFLTLDQIEQKNEDAPVVETNQTPIVEIKQKTYTTVKGDTLWKIASVHLGSGTKYKQIMKANNMKNTIVRPGMVLIIPEA